MDFVINYVFEQLHSFRKMRYGLFQKYKYSSLLKVNQVKISEATFVFFFTLYRRVLYSMVLIQMTLDVRQ